MLLTSRTSPRGRGGRAACSSFTARCACSAASGPAACAHVAGSTLRSGGRSLRLPVPARQIRALEAPPIIQPSNSFRGCAAISSPLCMETPTYRPPAVSGAAQISVTCTSKYEDQRPGVPKRLQGPSATTRPSELLSTIPVAARKPRPVATTRSLSNCTSPPLAMRCQLRKYCTSWTKSSHFSVLLPSMQCTSVFTWPTSFKFLALSSRKRPSVVRNSSLSSSAPLH
mmetsp:Transcript_40786/g.113385  ORF Transcript_40786/g.113385 Transcript_40786/m.113385 type:complete len:227 (+) Transcript_40786:403-1083(+)